jgi:hypothetical protein
VVQVAKFLIEVLINLEMVENKTEKRRIKHVFIILGEILVMSFLTKKTENELKFLNYLQQRLFTNEVIQTDLETSSEKISKIW